MRYSRRNYVAFWAVLSLQCSNLPPKFCATHYGQPNSQINIPSCVGRKLVLLSASVIGIPLSSTASPARTILLSKPFHSRRWTTISFHYCTFSLSLSVSFLVINRDGYCSCTQFSPPLLLLMISRSVALLSLHCGVFQCEICKLWKLQKIYRKCERFLTKIHNYTS